MPGPTYRELPPSAALARNVACYWTLRADRAEASRVLPDGCMDLLFDLRGGAVPAVVGAMTRPLLTSEDKGPVHLLGVRFRPGEAFAFLARMPARHVRDALAPLHDVWGSLSAELGEQLASLPDTATRVRRLEAVLLARRGAPADGRLRRAVASLESSSGAVRVARLAKDLELGERQLERLFDERVGIGPKTLARVARVRTLLARLETGRDWAALASELGFSDQAHLSRELRDLAGLTPTQLARALRMSDSSKPALGPLPMLPA